MKINESLRADAVIMGQYERAMRKLKAQQRRE
jgi:hypothetical protein